MAHGLINGQRSVGHLFRLHDPWKVGKNNQSTPSISSSILPCESLRKRTSWLKYFVNE